MSVSAPEIHLHDVSKKFSRPGQEEFVAVSGLSIDIARGEMVAVLGRTGCGKSTMFSMIAGLVAVSSGELLVQGMDPFRQFNQLRGRIAVVFQNDRLLPWRNVLDNAALGLEILDVERTEREDIARRWLGRLGLSAHLTDYPHALSGGMRQRVSIARAFATPAPLLLCDEPFSALDEITAQRLREEFAALVRETGRTAIFITHSVPEALQIGERILVMRPPGQIAFETRISATTSDVERGEIRKKIHQILGE